MIGSLFANDELSKKSGTTLNDLVTNKTNPFLYGFNEIIRFNDLQVGDITEATNTVIKKKAARIRIFLGIFISKYFVFILREIVFFFSSFKAIKKAAATKLGNKNR